MKILKKNRTERREFPDESFISCLCCIPRAWTLFANNQWTRVFESRDEGLNLVKEFRGDRVINFLESISLMDKISLWLDEAVWNDEFDHLVIVAPTPILDRINKALSPPVLARTIAEVDWPAGTESASDRRRDLKSFYSIRDKNQ